MLNNTPEVLIVCDSINEWNQRITTFQLKYWRPILPEMNTHRVFSRNAASSRAKTFESRMKEACEETFVPTHWNQEKRGMVGGPEFSDEIKEIINDQIQAIAERTVADLSNLDNYIYQITGSRIHKQYLNRYLEPFVAVDQIITATDWSNFFKLRMAEDAQPEIKDIAVEMFYALQDSVPSKVSKDEWHLPYISDKDLVNYGLEMCKKISVARCARVTYKVYNGQGDIDRDMRLFDRLLQSGHMSPFEHVCTPCYGKYYNIEGWKSMRNLIECQ